MNLTNKVAIITGASSGIGAATAKLFSELGARLVLVGRNEEALSEVVKECKTDHVVKVLGDLTDDVVLKNIVDEAIRNFGRLDVLVNNAGMGIYSSFENMQIDDYDTLMNVNLRSAIKLTQLALPHLAETKGNIVNVSSVCGTRSLPNVFGYSISKAGMDQFTKCAALELSAKGIRVNSVNPGVIVTNFQNRAGMNEENYKTFLEHCKTTHPLGRAGNASEVANTIAFLASDASSFVTGELVHVDGGRHVACPR